MNKKQIEARVMERGYRYEGSWVATQDDVIRGEQPYGCPCQEGDLLVEMCGFDLGAVPWVENFGQ